MLLVVGMDYLTVLRSFKLANIPQDHSTSLCKSTLQTRRVERTAAPLASPLVSCLPHYRLRMHLPLSLSMFSFYILFLPFFPFFLFLLLLFFSFLLSTTVLLSVFIFFLYLFFFFLFLFFFFFLTLLFSLQFVLIANLESHSPNNFPPLHSQPR